MNRSQLKAMLWMRWRIMVNTMRRAGKLNNALFGVLLGIGALVSLASFVLSLLVGLEELEGTAPMTLMYVWLGISLGFSFFWMLGLLTELQRSDSMSFKNLLHLPVSLGWVFLYNYFSSFLSISMVLFLPAMIGLSLALVLVVGPSMLLSFLLVLGFIGMITAVTYQLRGWLARMMEDKRRGRNIVMGITFAIVLLAQVPNFINMSTSSGDLDRRILGYELMLQAQHEGPEQTAAQERYDNFLQEEAETAAARARTISLLTVSVPLGWLPYGVRASYEGRYGIALLCAFGLFAITGLSLRRSYRKTVAAFVGGGLAKPVTDSVVAKKPSGPRKALLVEGRLPWLPEQASAVTLMSLRGLLRAPETKMMLLSPIIMIGLFGMMLSKRDMDSGMFWAPAMTLGAMSMGLLSLQQILQNQFGLDRDGFRAFLLAPVPRETILLGKDLALAPLGLSVGLIALVLLQVMMPLDLSHFLGALFQLLSSYLLICLVGNLLSILSPMRLKGVGMKSSGTQGKAFMVHMLSIFFVPLALSPLLIPWGIELYFAKQEWLLGFPIYLVLHIVMCLCVFAFFRWCLKRQGALLQQRELRILETLTRN